MSNTTPITCWITGANGQLGRCLRDVIESDSHVKAVLSTRDDLDLADLDQVISWIDRYQPDVVINAAAYTAVDRAEEEEEAAQLGNATVAATIAGACASLKIPLIHVSTDYVFDGEGTRPYREDDPVNPQSAYGRSKLNGERAVLAASSDNMVVRTAWLYSEYGHNFVKTMLRLGNEKESIGVVNDQLGSPTYAGDLARALIAIVTKIAADRTPNYGGIYHYTNGGTATWFDLASAVMEYQKLSCKVNPCTTDEFPTKARRPAYSVLDTQKIRTTFGLEIPYWKDALSRALSKIPTQ